MRIPDNKTQVDMLRDMIRVRASENKIIELFNKGIMFGLGHMSVGQEASSVGTVHAIRKTDYIMSNHRGHGHAIAKGVPIEKVVGELLGKSIGACKGMGGSLHITDMALGEMGSNGIVGANFGLSLGVAYGIKYKNKDDIIVNFCGDGSVQEGIFHESMNMAALWKLPLMVVCENNLYAVTTSFKNSSCVPRVSDRALGYKIKGRTIDGNDILAVYDAVSEAADYVRAGEPYILELLTYRWFGHSLRVSELGYRTREEEEEWKAKCPIKRFAGQLLKESIITQKEIDEIYEKANEELEAAVEKAIKSDITTFEQMKSFVFAQ
ncbi:MAG: thiamine pyrophosphate-dependent dehydrogenase E1 component subunit alpha [Lachnospiraceae bacterium]|nr:thiamine pyrophosphate-dependent dehydrogenase E1 component subunit alpha [Lachnospiraceae bacterium]